MSALEQDMETSKTSWITCSKNLQKDMFPRDPNFGVFSDTYGQVSETYPLDWSQVYSIFNNNNLSDFHSNQLVYEKIRDSGLHMIAARPVILPYNDAVRWIKDHTNLKYHSFNTSIGKQLANSFPKTFARIYALKPFT